MASVRLKPGSAHYFACFKMPSGRLDAKGREVFRRVQRSTGTSDQSRALQLALSYERVAVLAAERRFTERAAKNFLAEVRALTQVEANEVEATETYLWRWYKGRASGLAAHTRERYQVALRQFLAHLGAQAKAPLSEVTARRVAEWRDAESAAGKSPTTVNMALGVLALAFDEAMVQHGLERNPARGLNVKGAKRRRQRRRPFTFEQFAALVKATEGEWRTLVMLCGYTGARQQEATKLRWEQVNLKSGRLTLDRQKNADTHWLPVHPSLAKHLRGLRRSADGFVMPELATMQRRAVSNNFRRAVLPRIGITQAYAAATEEKGAGRRLAEYSLHSLRHSLSTWLAAAGVEESMRMQLIGHEDAQVNRGYTHTDLSQAAAALGRVPSVATSPAPE